jgi:hypothetical protein
MTQNLKSYITDFLKQISAPGDRVTVIDLAGRVGFSRQTLYNWSVNRQIAQEHFDKLVRSMHELAVAKGDRGLTEDAIARDLSELVTIGDPGTPLRFGLINYPPICGLPQPGEWNFLGELLKRFWHTFSDETYFPAQAFEIDDEPLAGAMVSVGLFPTPSRTEQYEFVRTPMEIPLNAVVAWKDVTFFRENVLPGRHPAPHPRNNEELIAELSSALFKLESASIETTRDLRPIVANEESGAEFLKAFHQFRFQPDKNGRPFFSPLEGPNADKYLDELEKLSDKFNAAPIRDRPSTDGDRRIPIVVADEMTCLEILLQAQNRGVGKHTRFQLIFDPKLDLEFPGRTNRPRYSPALAYRARVSGSGVDFPRSFEEFLWSYSGIVAAEYVRLYKTLCEMYGDLPQLQSCGPAYFLRWLSLSPPRRFDDGVQVTKSEVQISREGRIWSDVISTSASLIEGDDQLSQAIKSCLAAHQKGRTRSKPKAGRTNRDD